MSSAVFSTSAAQGRPFLFDVEGVAEVCPQPSGAELFGDGRPPQRVGTFKDARLSGVTPASRLAVRPTPEMVSSGIAAMDALTGGLPRGCLTEICGSASSGRTTLLLAALAAATRRGEYCAVVDAGDALHPQSAVDAGVDLDRLLWVRCGENSPQKCLEQLLRAADLLLESGGFGLIALDLGDLPPQTARHIPLTTWFRFRRAVEHTPTVLLAVERQSIAGSCSSLLIKLGLASNQPLSVLDQAGGSNYRNYSPAGAACESPARQCREGMGSRSESRRDGTSSHTHPEGPKNIDAAEPFPHAPTHAQLLTELEITAEIVRSRMDRKPSRSTETIFASKTAWAG